MKALSVRNGLLAVLVAGLVVASACTDNGSGPNTGGTQVLLTDAPFPYEDVARVDVYIKSVEASAEFDTSTGVNWISIAQPEQAFNLLELQRGSTALLGDAELPAGQYAAIRMTIDPAQSSITMDDGSLATVHWGHTSGGLIIMHALVEEPLATGPGARIVIDFDVGRSFLVLESFPEQFVFSPWIRAVNEAATGEISGNVAWTNSIEGCAGFGGQCGPLANASITVYRQQGANPLGWWVAATGTSDANGDYAIAFLREGSYQLRFAGTTPEGYGCSQFVDIAVTPGQVTTLNAAVFPHDGCVDPDPDPDTTGTDTTSTPPEPGGPVASVTVQSWHDGNVTVGDSVGVMAQLANAEGATLSNRTVTWAFSDSTIFAINSQFGQYTILRALKAGTTRVTATSEGKSGFIDLVVH